MVSTGEVLQHKTSIGQINVSNGQLGETTSDLQVISMFQAFFFFFFFLQYLKYDKFSCIV